MRQWLCGLIAVGMCLAVAQGRAADPQKLRVYLGTYTGEKSKGIYQSELDLRTGRLAPPELAGEAVNPSFLALHPSGKLLLAVNEISDLNGKKVGGISSFSIEPKTGKLTKISQTPSGGPGPCHLSVDKTGKFVLAANYGGGSVCVAPIDLEGKLGELSAYVKHESITGEGGKVKEPRAHSINMSPDNRFAIAADAGVDKLFIYKLESAGTLTANTPPSISTPPNTAPRHFAFHPNTQWAYSCLEASSEIAAFTYDAAKGSFAATQTLSTLPEPVKGNSTAEVQVHPSGKWAYVSNRGHNSIAIFAIAADGKLTAQGHQGAGVKIPRNFGVDPTGQYLVVCNQEPHNVIVFKIDQNSGKLEPTNSRIEVGAPVCVKFMSM